jgi:hypothetical protein
MTHSRCHASKDSEIVLGRRDAIQRTPRGGGWGCPFHTGQTHNSNTASYGLEKYCSLSLPTMYQHPPRVIHIWSWTPLGRAYISSSRAGIPLTNQ